MLPTIGLMDSGLGGLSVLKDVMAAGWPSIVYVADTARLPYGTKSPQEVASFTRQAVARLQAEGAKRVVIACNTASAYGLEAAQEAFSFPISGMIGPASQEAAQRTRKKKVLFLATKGTVKSGHYEAALHALDPDIQVEGIPLDDLVLAVEAGHVEDQEAQDIIEEGLSQVQDPDFDTVILACTHFPLALPVFQRIFPDAEEVQLVNPAGAVVASLPTLSELQGDDSLDQGDDSLDQGDDSLDQGEGSLAKGGGSLNRGKKTIRFLVTGDLDAFQRVAREVLDFSDYQLSFEQAQLDRDPN